MSNSKSKHQKHIRLLKKLVDKTDYYVAHVWNEQGSSLHGKIDAFGRQKFFRYGAYYEDKYTPYLQYSFAGKLYFAVMPKQKELFGMVLTGWKELGWFVQKLTFKKECNEKNKGSL